MKKFKMLIVLLLISTLFSQSYAEVPDIKSDVVENVTIESNDPLYQLYNSLGELINGGTLSVKNNYDGPTLVRMIENKEIIKIKENSADIQFILKNGVVVTSNRARLLDSISDMKRVSKENNIKWTTARKPPNVGGFIFAMMTVMFFMYLLRKQQKEKVAVGGGKNAQKIDEVIPNVNFSDLQGCQELKNDAENIIKYLKEPDLLKDAGARMPKGLVLYGPPGTGKTLTAKAIAGTAGVPFFHASGSDFVEMYVGVGAKRVRELYKRAREKAPCIVFIDEIDAIGGKRGDDTNSERDQTINALLNELDGFHGTEGILTICATNRLELLDPALIRPGRFDKHLAVPLPDRHDRLSILGTHTKNKKIADDISLEELASKTMGFSGAALESLVNEAALIAVSNGRAILNKEDVDRAFFKIVMKGDKKENTAIRDKEELRVVAYHEAGHAILTKMILHEEVPMVTIMSSTSGAGGVTFRQIKETGLHSKKRMRQTIMMSYGGRAAEAIYFGNEDDITTGASKDIEQATQIIYDYVCSYGMSENGMLNLAMLSKNGLTDKTIALMENMSRDLYTETYNFMVEHRNILESIANALLEKETLNDEELSFIINGGVAIDL